ncbi:MAG TPA: PBP1A family penicillin-binding protein [Gemmatimonadaceae bacterium]|nr:PBP1A family penicillin-binding protein [Gemmatimonadaceae bacterium]
MLRGFRQRHPALVRGTLLAFCFLLSFGTGLGYASWAMVCRSGRCPTIEVLDEYQPRQTSKLYAADGRFITELGLERRTLIGIDSIPKIVQDAFVVTEDKRFWEHKGVDFHAVPRAVLVDIRAGYFKEGFSTITMQLARNIFPERISREKAPLRKLKEIKVARAIEQRYDKKHILELYLNQINLGNGSYGVETASQRYFGKSVKDLNAAEAATLAALPKSPTRYNPRRNPEQSLQRRNTIIELMRQEGVITPEVANLARAYPLRLGTRQESGQVAPYFVEYIRQLLDEKFGKQLYEQGLNVYTTLDIDLEAAAERALERQLRRVEAGQYGPYRHMSYEYYIAKHGDDAEQPSNSPYLQGAFIAMDPRTGAIRALVGGRDFDDSKFNRAVQALRQPGSTFKPFVYAAAIQNGRPLSYLLDDSPLAVPMGDGSEWKPQNYDGGYLGKIPMRQALYMSQNVATIKLGMELGETGVIDMARKFGISTPIPAYPSIFLGAAEVYPIEMVGAYSAFATLGQRAVPQAIVRVESNKGEVLWEPEVIRVPVMSAEESWLMVSAMKDVVRRGTAQRFVGAQFSRPAGGKTGTTNDGTDVWFVGYTTDLVAGVWMGFDKPKKIKPNAQGGHLAAPAWTAFMNEVYRRRPSPPDWPMPSGIIQKSIDVTTNEAASPYCPANVIANEYFIPGTDPVYPCSVHTQFGLYPDTLGAYPPGSYPPSTYPGYTPPPIDTSYRTGGRATRPRDSMATRNLDSLVWTIPRRDTARSTVFPRDTTSRRIRPDTLVKPDTLIRRPRPDTIRPRPDTTRPRPDTIRPRPDTLPRFR